MKRREISLFVFVIILICSVLPITMARATSDDNLDLTGTNQDIDSEEILIEDIGQDVIVDYQIAGELSALMVSSSAELSSADLHAALMMNGLSETQSDNATRNLLEDIIKSDTSSADGSSIDQFSVKWITKDSVDNNDPELLYIKSRDLNKITVRLRINYTLSGNHNYNPGDVTITIPATIFKDRNGNNIGNLKIPFAEEPSTKGDFNWKRVGDTYVLTNTKKLSAATKGYVELAIQDIDPNMLVDSALSDDFTAYIEAVTNAGNTIGRESNALNAQIDTEASAVKVLKNAPVAEPVRVSADKIPANQRIPGETEYIVATWYVYGDVAANTMYNIELIDTILDEYGGFVLENETPAVYTKENNINKNWDNDYIYSPVRLTYKTAYPASQFQPDTTYVFRNKIEMRITEADPAVGSDPQLTTVQIASRSQTYRYRRPTFVMTSGTFNVFKAGNDGASGNYVMHNYRGSTFSATYDIRYQNWYYGIYKDALNKLRKGAESIELSYLVNSVGYILPWTYAPDGSTYSQRKLSNYGKYDVTMTAEETYLEIEGLGTLTVHEDYDFTAVEFPYTPQVFEAETYNLNEDGSFISQTEDGGIRLKSQQSGVDMIPPITLQIKTNGVWKDYATVTYSSLSADSAVTTILDTGEIIYGRRVPLPNDADSFRTVVTTNVPYISYKIRPVVTLYNTEKLKNLVDQAFENSHVPSFDVTNHVRMDLERTNSTGSKTTIGSIKEQAYNDLRGYSYDSSAQLSKSFTQTLNDVDYESRRVTIHYSANMTYQTYMPDISVWNTAVANGEIIPETHCVWYDLLPKGAVPIRSSIKMRRSKDRVVDIKTIEDYKGTGRTLLIVEANLTPNPVLNTYGDTRYLQDIPGIQFNAYYSFEDIIDYGDSLHNVIAYEGSNDTLGSVQGATGEPDNPRGRNNVRTMSAFADYSEIIAMTDLNADHDKPVFLYAGVTNKLDYFSGPYIFV